MPTPVWRTRDGKILETEGAARFYEDALTLAEELDAGVDFTDSTTPLDVTKWLLARYNITKKA